MILAAGKPLKCGRMSGPAVHSVLTTADSGTILPWLERVYSRVRSAGCCRKSASDCMTTHHTRLYWLNWLTVSEPNCACMAL